MLKRLPYTSNDGRELAVTRRRYSNKTFTWVHVKVGDEWKDIGTPWECVTPKRAEVLAAADMLLNDTAAVAVG